MKLLLSVIDIACLLSFKTLENHQTFKNTLDCKYNQCQATNRKKHRKSM
ncbi:hypothetical protein F7642_02365 [Tenacibaculum finnmarkense genomovar ulcerans]|nr:hypothetical protein [Tenacibaculum finnmarkense]MBE7633173.1 hypothetical protein [Tenacibaculum finnmarkense genomovar ulcerans]MCD8429087.1 hypothetical protein [Tenacibaculum finnmarkense genomovar ulcerans]